jgi:hypothetical protein
VDNLKRRNPPKTSKPSKTEKFNAEILHSPYREGVVEGKFSEVAGTDVVSPVRQPVPSMDCLETTTLLEFLKSLAIPAALRWCKQLSRGASRRGGHLVGLGSQGRPSVPSRFKGGQRPGEEVEGATPKPRLKPSIFLAPVPVGGVNNFVARDHGPIRCGAQNRVSSGQPAGYCVATAERSKNKKATVKGRL